MEQEELNNQLRELKEYVSSSGLMAEQVVYHSHRCPEGRLFRIIRSQITVMAAPRRKTRKGAQKLAKGVIALI